MLRNNFSINIDLIKKLNTLLLLGFVALSIVVVCLSFTIVHMVSHKDRIVTTPNMHGTYNVSSDKPGQRYLKQASEYMLSLSFNITPKNVDRNFNNMLEYVSADKYSEFAALLRERAKKIKADDVSSVFYPSDWQVDADQLKVIIVGTLKKSVGRRKLDDVQTGYEIQFSYPAGQLELQTIKRVEVKS